MHSAKNHLKLLGPIYGPLEWQQVKETVIFMHCIESVLGIVKISIRKEKMLSEHLYLHCHQTAIFFGTTFPQPHNVHTYNPTSKEPNYPFKSPLNSGTRYLTVL